MQSEGEADISEAQAAIVRYRFLGLFWGSPEGISDLFGLSFEGIDRKLLIAQG